MKVGTKSVLYGAHCLFIHPVFVLIAWIKLYGWPWDPRLWVAFFVHDLGYWGKPNMDGEEGEMHPELGAILMHKWFDRSWYSEYWYNFCRFHSKSYAINLNAKPSPLYAADKLAMALEPKWLYMLRVKLTGEIHEYFAMSRSGALNFDQWYTWTAEHMRMRAYEYRDNNSDAWTPWTPEAKRAINTEGVWQ